MLDNNPIYFESLIANAISDSENDITAIVSTSNEGSTTDWVFQSSTVSVSNINIVANGTVLTGMSTVTGPVEYTQGIFVQENDNNNSVELSNASMTIVGGVNDTWYEYLELTYGYLWTEFEPTQDPDYEYPDSNWTSFAQATQSMAYIINEVALAFGYVYQNYAPTNVLTEDIDPYVLDDYQVANFAVSSTISDVSGNVFDSTGMQILGHYSFTDYLVILGTWPEASAMYGQQKDFVIKTSQKKDGKLVTPDDIEPGDIYQLFFVGNLGFSNKKKLKVVGSEESSEVRRIYFTDGDIPLRTMNVGLSPQVYSGETNNPGYFDLFVESLLSVPKVTGMKSGGSLDSVGHAYCFRYKTKDGRFSRKSPISNPASVPISNLGEEAAFTHGGNPGDNSGKSITGIIENLDKRFDYLEMIHIPYIDGAPGVAQIFNTYPIPKSEDITQLSWTHTGAEIIDEEITVEAFGTDNIAWDTCKALEVKDNRLFCGNLKGVVTTPIETDFTVVSYNAKNQRHSYETGNPHLYHDLLYSYGGMTFQNGEASVHKPRTQDNGRYCNPDGIDMYRYIRNHENGSGTDSYGTFGDAFFSDNMDVPTFWPGDNGFGSWSNFPLPEPFAAKRGIFGAESKYFKKYTLPEGVPGAGDHEGVRVTFRVLGDNEASPAPAVQLDKDSKLITTGTVTGAQAPFYKVDSGSDGKNYYANYANPYYNSNFVGYRRGEVYRFGILFYDKKGSPMFVKRIGDIRMPEHSTEHLVPKFTGSQSPEITGFKKRWPYYYQTSRHAVDQGFSNHASVYLRGSAPAKGKLPYEPGDEKEGHHGCVLYPYFEVRLSSDTCKKISGYSIVRCERTDEYRSVVTSGVLQRAVKYADDNAQTLWNGDSPGPNNPTGQSNQNWAGANRCGMAGKFGNYHLSIFTPTMQEYCSNLYGNNIYTFIAEDEFSTHAFSVEQLQDATGEDPIGGNPYWSHSNIFTMDSPDAILNPNFNLNFSGGDRIKITESRYCYKEAIVNGGTTGRSFPHFFNSFLADAWYGGSGGSGFSGYNNTAGGPFTYQAGAIGLFACLIDPNLIDGADVSYEGITQNFGGWNHQLSPYWSQSTHWEREIATFDTISRFRTGGSAGTTITGGSLTNAWDQGDGNGPLNWADDEYPNVFEAGQQWNRWYNLGIYTKYYSKRIGAYPMYGMARPDWSDYKREADSTDGSSEFDSDGKGMSIAAMESWSEGEEIDRFLSPQFAGISYWGSGSYGYCDEIVRQYGNEGGLDLNTGAQAFNQSLVTKDKYYKEGMRACHIMPDIIGPAYESYDGEKLATTLDDGDLNPYWYETKLVYAGVVGPGQEVGLGKLGSDRSYKNATMWHDPIRFSTGNTDENALEPVFSYNTNRHDRNFQLGGNMTGNINNSDWDDPNTWSEVYADFSSSNKKIVMSLPNHAMLPITRHCIEYNNQREKVGNGVMGGPAAWGFRDNGDGDSQNIIAGLAPSALRDSTNYASSMGGPRWSQYSPEVTMASIARKQDLSTMYGGNSLNAFAKNTFISTGHFQQVDTNGTFSAIGTNGNHVFGGDTYICNFSIRQVYNDKTNDIRTENFTDNVGGTQDINYSDRGVLTAYTCPVETETNVDLRHGLFFGGDSQSIPKRIPDDTGSVAYNNSYSSPNSIQLFNPKPIDFIELNQWPSTIAWSDPKLPGDFNDNYSIFPVNQLKDLDYTKGEITQLFSLQNKLFALQNSGTCLLSVNPRVAIPTQGGGAIQAVTGTDNVVERFDYVSESVGSQHFHGLAVTDSSAYYFDANNSSFIQLKRTQGGGFGTISLGDSQGVQSFFQQYKNKIINDNPLYSPQPDNILSLETGGDYNINKNSYYTNFRDNIQEGIDSGDMSEKALNMGGINIGYDPEFSEILLTIYPNEEVPFTLVYSEALDTFTSFISKRPSGYINFKNRLYCTYDTGGENSNTSIYLANGYNDFTSAEMDNDFSGKFKYLTFGEIDYYIFGHKIPEDPTVPLEFPAPAPYYINQQSGGNFSLLEQEMEQWGVQSSLYNREPVQIQFIINDENFQPKIFDNLDIHIRAESDIGSNHLYFRKFAFKGAANRFSFSEYDVSEISNLILPGQVADEDSSSFVQQDYSAASTGFYDYDGEKLWYSVKEGTHHVPFKGTGLGLFNGPFHDPTCRGTYALVGMVMGYDEGSRFFGKETDFTSAVNVNEIETDIIPKNESYNILSVIPYYRYSRR